MITWKSVLKNYIKDCNRMAIEHSIDPLKSYVMDQHYLLMESIRLKRLELNTSLNQIVTRTETSARPHSGT